MKLKKTMRVLSALALSLILSMGGLTTVFAAGPITGTEANPAQAVITKELKMPEGTTTPAATFKFQFAKKSIDDKTTQDDLDTMPDIADKSVTFAATDTGNTSSGLKSVTKETASLFSGIDWKHAGVYVYTVTEQSGTYTTGTGETMTYSNGSYDIAVYVANGASGLYVSDIGTTIVVADNASQVAGDKTDPTTSTTVTGAYSAMLFTNQYQKMNGGTDVTDPAHQTLAISKTVAGTYGDLTKYFTYDVTVTESTLSSGVTYKGYVVENGTVVTSTDNGAIGGTDVTNGDYINFPSGTAVSVKLKHGQTLAFIDNEVGSNYVANELAAEDYTASASIIVNGGVPVTINNTSANTDLSTATRTIGESTNSAAFTNTYKTITPTGISLNNLPFIMMIVLAVIGLATYVVVKSRKSYNK